MKFEKEIKMLEDTVDRKDLSTSSSTIEGELKEERMVRKSRTTVRQDTQKVSTSSDMVTVCSYIDLSPFRSTIPSQSEIFSVIVGCS